MTFGYRLPCHFEQLQRFSVAARERKLERPDIADLEPTGFILEPFVCHNVYRALKGARVDTGRTIQAMNSTKLEFKLAIDATSSTAAGSFNLHGRHFTEPMQIADGQARSSKPRGSPGASSAGWQR